MIDGALLDRHTIGLMFRSSAHSIQPAMDHTATTPHRPMRRRLRALVLALMLGAVPGSMLMASMAHAEFRLCNRTQSRIGIAVGYKDGNMWHTEGWWNVGAESCETLLRGDLMARFYYVYAVDYDQGGEWTGKAYMCTRDKEFTIRGANDCLARGFERTGFMEVDTQEQKSWTVQLTQSNQQSNADNGARQVEAPLPVSPPDSARKN